jgi:predicted nucleotidyltransferase component of viral defense system
MLSYKAIDSATLGILKKIQSEPEFSGLRLVGGTALALQLSHRKSVDIDLFGALNSDSIQIMKKLTQAGRTVLLNKSENISIYSVDEIKVDIVNYPYKWLEPPIEEDGLTLAGMRDIAAMKLAAITNRGSKKDFIDIFFLLHHFELSKLLDFYQEKYHDGSVFHVLKSLSYFDDAEDEASPVMLSSVQWKKVKEHILKSLETHLRNLHLSKAAKQV